MSKSVGTKVVELSKLSDSEFYDIFNEMIVMNKNPEAKDFSLSKSHEYRGFEIEGFRFIYSDLINNNNIHLGVLLLDS